MKKMLLVFTLIMFCSLSGCASQADKDVAASVDKKIQDISEVTVDNISVIQDIEKEFEALSDKQKMLVSRKDDLQDFIASADRIIAEGSPSNTIKKDDMVGIWREITTDRHHRRYLYFDSNENIYYLNSEEDSLSVSDFTSDDLIASSYELDGFDTKEMGKIGTFNNTQSNNRINFIVSIIKANRMQMKVNGIPISGIYLKQDSNQKSNIKETTSSTAKETNSDKTKSSSTHICIAEGCSKPATHKINGTSGTEWYCDEHYEFIENFTKEIYSHLPDCAICGKSASYEDPYEKGTFYCEEHYRDALNWYLKH